MRAAEELLSHRESVVQRQGQDPHSRTDRVAAADPVPEAKSRFGTESEIKHFGKNSNMVKKKNSNKNNEESKMMLY